MNPNRISIRISDEGHMTHRRLKWSKVKIDPGCLKLFDRCLKVIHFMPHVIPSTTKDPRRFSS